MTFTTFLHQSMNETQTAVQRDSIQYYTWFHGVVTLMVMFWINATMQLNAWLVVGISSQSGNTVYYVLSVHGLN